MSVRSWILLGILCALPASRAVAQTENTPPGSPLVYLLDGQSDLRASVQFTNVSGAGNTVVNGVSVPGPTGGWDVGATPEYWEISTSAAFTGQLEVFLYYDPDQVPEPWHMLRLLQLNYDDYTWEDITEFVDVENHRVGGITSSLSPFALAVPAGATPVGDSPASAHAVLHANVPNPFNPVTTIQYEVPAGGADVTIDVYDVHGARVRTLVNTHRSEGSYTVQWNGEDNRGERATSGVYFYRMTAGSFVETRKMVLVK